MADSKKYNGSTWVHSLRKLTTATEAVENPLYSDGTAIASYTISGNTVQNGTPIPSNPVMPNGVGERTENLFDDTFEVGSIGSTGQNVVQDNQVRQVNYCTVEPSTVYRAYVNNYTPSEIWANYYTDSGSFISRGDVTGAPFTTPSNCGRIRFRMRRDGTINTNVQLMLNEGSTALPYEPYGYKIPISSGGVTTNIYLGNTQSTRQIKKLVLTGEEEWYRYSSSGRTPYIYMDISIGQITVPNEEICSHFESAQISGTNNNQGIGVQFRQSGTYTSLFARYDGITDDVQTFTTYLHQQYAAGTPVTVWYVLATEETGIVNEPLMKIGIYADTLSNAAQIPSTEGANSITVDTTVHPSEFMATWTGWHDTTVKEWDGQNWT